MTLKRRRMTTCAKRMTHKLYKWNKSPKRWPEGCRTPTMCQDHSDKLAFESTLKSSAALICVRVDSLRITAIKSQWWPYQSYPLLLLKTIKGTDVYRWQIDGWGRDHCRVGKIAFLIPALPDTEDRSEGFRIWIPSSPLGVGRFTESVSSALQAWRTCVGPGNNEEQLGANSGRCWALHTHLI